VNIYKSYILVKLSSHIAIHASYALSSIEPVSSKYYDTIKYLELLWQQKFFNISGRVRVNKSFDIIQPGLATKKTVNIFTYNTGEFFYLR